MCGICGFNWEEDNLLKVMCKTMTHRGPNDQGVFNDKKFSLGIRRLSIIDIEGGKQPIHNEDESLWIVHNGEVYNFKSLRLDLESKGHKFYTKTDTEVVLHAYEEYGEKFLYYLEGMFAFAIWDSKQKKLFLARDRLGIKPIYYYFKEGKFIFASEIKTILQYTGLKKEIDYISLNNFFTFRYAPGERTVLEDVYKLLPGHYLLFDDKKVSIKKYWDMNFSEEKNSLDVCKKRFLELFEESVKKCLVGEVPIGAFISGGIDSSAIIAFASKMLNKPIKTFTLGFDGFENNEFSYAKKVSDCFNTDHHEILIGLEGIRKLPEVIYYLDEPLADPTCIPTYILSQNAVKSVGVILSGEGADEILAGYEQYKIMKLKSAYNKCCPRIVRNCSAFIVKHLAKDDFFEKISNFSRSEDVPQEYIELLSIFNKSEKNNLYSTQFLGKTININEDIDLLRPYFQPNVCLLNQLLLSDIKTGLPDNMLLKLDKMTMAHSVEGRVPFLDHKLVEFSSKIPCKFKLKGFDEKFILKKSMLGKLPKSILSRKKQRFFLPTDSWFKKGLESYSQEVLDSEFMTEQFFNKDALKKLFNYKESVSYKFFLKHNSLSSLYYSRQVWTLLTFEIWYRTFIEREKIAKPLNMAAL